jgi:hypothetical protein
MPDPLIARSSEVTKSSFCAVAKPIGRERLMCSGSGTPRSLVKKECILTLSISDRRLASRIDIILVNESYSAVEGYPRSN